MHLKSYLSNKYVWLACITLFFILRFSSGYFSESVETYTNSQIRSYSTDLINQSIADELLSTMDFNDILVENYDNSGKVSYAYLNSNKINRIKYETTDYIQNVIERINNHEDLQSIEVPIGYFLGSKFFLADGLKVPINLDVIGNQSVEVTAEMLQHGINTTIIQIYLEVSLYVQVVIPFQSQVVETTSKIPIAFEIMNNEVPYYLGELLEKNGG